MFQVQGSRFRVQGSGFRVQSSEFRVQGSRFNIGSRGAILTATGAEGKTASQNMESGRPFTPPITRHSFQNLD
jgi:hypothetical protein